MCYSDMRAIDSPATFSVVVWDVGKFILCSIRDITDIPFTLHTSWFTHCSAAYGPVVSVDVRCHNSKGRNFALYGNQKLWQYR